MPYILFSYLIKSCILCKQLEREKNAFVIEFHFRLSVTKWIYNYIWKVSVFYEAKTTYSMNIIDAQSYYTN